MTIKRFKRIVEPKDDEKDEAFSVSTYFLLFAVLELGFSYITKPIEKGITLFLVINTLLIIILSVIRLTNLNVYYKEISPRVKTKMPYCVKCKWRKVAVTSRDKICYKCRRGETK